MRRPCVWPGAGLLIALTLAMWPVSAIATSPLPGQKPTEVPAAVAPTAISRDEAVRIARDRFAVPTELGEPTVSSYKTESWHVAGAGVPVWRIDWRYKVDAPFAEGKYAVLIRGDTGDVMSFSRNFGGGSGADSMPPGLPRLTRSLARERAEAEVQRLARRYTDQLRPEPERALDPPPPLARSHAFRWERVARGIPHGTDGARVVIDAFSGDLLEFTFIWNSQPIPAPGPYLTELEATAGFRDAVRLDPVYRRFDAPEGPRWRVVYQPLMYKYPAVDAHSGALLDASGNSLDMADRNRLAALPPHDTAYVPPPVPLDRVQALAVARALGADVDPLEVQEITRVGLIDQYEYRGPFPAFSEAPAVDRLTAEGQAVRFLTARRPDLAAHVRLVAGPVAAVRVFRNDTAVQDAQIDVDVLAATGAVVRFRIRDGAIRSGERDGAIWQPPQAPVDSQWAMDRLLAQAPLTLGWRRLPAPAQSPALQWRVPVSEYDSIDARTGHLVNYDGRDRLTTADLPVDVTDRPNRDAIVTLVTHGFMSSSNGRFRPDGSVTRAEAARLIVQMHNSRLPGQPVRFSFPEAADLPVPIAAWIQAAYDAGYVPLPAGEPFRPDARVTRAEFALWVTRALGYGALLNAGVDMAAPNADTSALPPAHRNAVTLLTGLGAFAVGADGLFQPESPLTRGEAAPLLYMLGARIRRW